ncbi:MULTISPECIES: mycofactocin system transcriptional regulator [Aeromicrobium]|uniref:mycofactocin system transcriptional regulator n=1 Tax=Aeromicrobium TaxID=2040 RepID=UPI0006F1E62B|nr:MULTISPECIES: mycofactocin system transcriptional regulator [Aeromicrobium]KQX74029.1 mycofactocin system transcriptional regulator [Aeromicrobium sp. Root472D3]MCL8252218.1 mycofactocin system transcriptional regulator [Aeromicrobium fastidiosum]
MDQRPRPTRGRPVATTHEEIEEAAFRLFDERGFAETTVEAIAESVGIGRRTLFRYFDSKNDIPWGRFADSLDHFREILADSPPGLPLHESVHQAMLRFNDFGPHAAPQHRRRMGLILSTPALQAHSVLRYAQWRGVIADHVADRTGLAPGDLLPVTVGHVSLALALSAYEFWLAHEESDLLDLLDSAMAGLRDHLA